MADLILNETQRQALAASLRESRRTMHPRSRRGFTVVIYDLADAMSLTGADRIAFMDAAGDSDRYRVVDGESQIIDMEGD